MKQLFSILFCLTLLGCQQQEDGSAPENLIPRDKMVQILADVHVMESLVETHTHYPDTSAMVYNKQHKLILDKYKVSSEQFYETYNYYGANIEEMDKLYEIILDTLSVREAKLASVKGNTPEVDDALLVADDSTTAVKRPLRKRDPLRRPQDVLMRSPN